MASFSQSLQLSGMSFNSLQTHESLNVNASTESLIENRSSVSAGSNRLKVRNKSGKRIPLTNENIFVEARCLLDQFIQVEHDMDLVKFKEGISSIGFPDSCANVVKNIIKKVSFNY